MSKRPLYRPVAGHSFSVVSQDVQRRGCRYRPGDTAETMVKRTDKALYEAADWPRSCRSGTRTGLSRPKNVGRRAIDVLAVRWRSVG